MKKYLLVISIVLILFFPKTVSAQTTYTLDDVQSHNTVNDCWMIFEDKVYDVTSRMEIHNTSYLDITAWCGKDMTNDFKTKAGEGKDHKPGTYTMLDGLYIGDLSMDETTATETEEEITTSSDEQPNEEIRPANRYNFFAPFLGTLLLYSVTYLLKKKKVFAKPNFDLLWNSLMVVFLVPSVVFGIFMVLRYQFPTLWDLNFDFKYWHVEGSIAFGTLVVLHFFMRWGVYLVPFRRLLKKRKVIKSQSI
jgi:hypothetical protein